MIRPLDLQTLYMNLDKVGKEAAQNRDSIHNQQLSQGDKLTKEHELQKHAVGKTDTDSEKARQVNEHPQSGGQTGGGGGKKRAKPAVDAEVAKEEPEDFQDDRVGRHIDISG